ncbi:MAG: type II secretion system protein GspM [Candidatus Binatia bacterium]
MKRIWQRLSKREKGLVISAILILLMVLARYLVVSPFLERRQWVRSQLEIQPQLLEKNLRYINQKGEIMAALEKDRGELKGLEPFLLSGDTDPVSASDLQQTVQALAAKEGTQVITTRVLNPESMGSFRKIPIQVEISGQVDQVANLIKGIEAAEKLLVVGELNVRSLFVPAGVARPPGAPQLPPQNLRASLIVSGFARSQPVPPQKSEPTPARTKSDEGKTPSKSAPRP